MQPINAVDKHDQEADPFLITGESLTVQDLCVAPASFPLKVNEDVFTVHLNWVGNQISSGGGQEFQDGILGVPAQKSDLQNSVH